MTIFLAVGSFAARLAFFTLACAGIALAFAHKSTPALKASFAASICLMASSAAGTHDPFRLIPFCLVLTLLALAAFCVRRLCASRPASAVVMPYVVLLVSIGFCLILDVEAGTTSAAIASTGAVSFEGALASYLPSMLKYAAFVGLGMVGLVGASYVAQHEVSILSGHCAKWLALGLALLGVVLLIGSEAGGAKSWLTLPAGISLQPSEFAKVALIVAAAGYLAANASRLAQFSLRGIVPIALAFAISLASVALQRDLGCALIIFVSLAVMMANSTKNGWVYLVLLALAGFALVLLAYYGFDHVRTRFDIWQNPTADPYGAGYQYRMAMQCLANGGLIGCGLGRGVHFNSMPIAESDYIYAVLCEELGLVGCFIVLACYAGIAWEAARRAAQLPRASFERNLVAAVGALIGCEAALIIGGVVNLIPLTGITMPLVSRGGSSLVASLVALGLMQGASASAKTHEKVSATGAENERALSSMHAYGGRIYSLQHGAPEPVEPSAAAKIAAAPIAGPPNVIAPHFVATALSLCLGACLASTALTQTGEDGLHLCGITAHENLRGSIVTADGIELARDEYLPRASDDDAEDDRSSDNMILKRVYPHDDLACHIIGMRSSGVEAAVDLKGNSPLANLLAIPEQGDKLKLTIDFDVQKAAEAELEGQTGAMVAIDPETGRILAMTSAPTYDLAGDERSAEESYFNRTSLGQYSPGSTFKLVTLASALEHGAASPSSAYEAPASLDVEGEEVRNFRGSSWGSISLKQATNYSANTAFAQVGMQLGADALIETAEGFGFNQTLDFCTGAESSVIAKLDSKLELAWAACGEPQREAALAASPLQMALVMCGIANNGVIMQPYLIEGRISTLGISYGKTEQEVFSEAISPDTAQQIAGILRENDAASAYCPYEIWGKTGTAEVDGAEDNAWYVCAAQHQGKKIVVACVIEQGGTGASAALPRAARVAAVALDEMTA